MMHFSYPILCVMFYVHACATCVEALTGAGGARLVTVVFRSSAVALIQANGMGGYHRLLQSRACKWMPGLATCPSWNSDRTNTYIYALFVSTIRCRTKNHLWCSAEAHSHAHLSQSHGSSTCNVLQGCTGHGRKPSVRYSACCAQCASGFRL